MQHKGEGGFLFRITEDSPFTDHNIGGYVCLRERGASGSDATSVPGPVDGGVRPRGMPEWLENRGGVAVFPFFGGQVVPEEREIFT